jgi:hypothetical protein
MAYICTLKLKIMEILDANRKKGSYEGKWKEYNGHGCKHHDSLDCRE